MGNPFYTIGPDGKPVIAGGGIKNPFDESKSKKKQRGDLDHQGQEAGGFADEGQEAFTALRGELGATSNMLRDQATGRVSLSAEQLRQGLQQNIAAQRAAQASASPQNAAMAARLGMNNMARLGYGFSGQAAQAGLAERMAAAKALADFQLQQRQQELQAALQSRQNAVGAYGGITPEQSGLEKALPFVNAAIGGASIFAGKGK
jgi:hypothetical protein